MGLGMKNHAFFIINYHRLIQFNVFLHLFPKNICLYYIFPFSEANARSLKIILLKYHF